MYKDKRHIILYKNKYITEKDYLNQRFKDDKMKKILLIDYNSFNCVFNCK